MGRKAKYSEEEIEKTLKEFVNKCIKEKNIPKMQELYKNNYKVFYFIRRNYKTKIKFIESYPELEKICDGYKFKDEVIYKDDLEKADEILSDLVEKWKDDGRVETNTEMLQFKEGQRNLYLIKEKYKTKRNFLEKQGLMQIYNKHFVEKGKKKFSEEDLYKMKKKIKKQLMKYIKKIGNKNVITKTKQELKEKIDFKNFTYKEFLKEMNVTRIPPNFYKLLLSLQKEIKKTGVIDTRKWKNTIYSDDKNSKSLRVYIYSKYKNNVLNKIIEEFQLK